MEETPIGNTLEETAYHEAGHVVVAGAVGLDLMPKGIVIYEVGDLTDGWAFYWEDKPEWEGILRALRAGQMAQLRRFPKSEFRGGKPDLDKFYRIVADHFGANRFGELWGAITDKVRSMLDAHWAAVVAIAEALVRGGWIPTESGEHASARRKKHLGGDVLAAILAEHGISAQVRR
jgi:hypothetical protein